MIVDRIQRENKVEARVLATGGLLEREIVEIELMGSSEEIRWKRTDAALMIQLPKTLPGKIINGFRIELN